MELIKISNEGGKQAVSARDLHEFLGSLQDFSKWIKKRIGDYDFIENQDFTTSDKKVERQILKEYYISLDMAKEISMVERNDKGKEARKYFIECEKKAHEVISLDPIIAMRQKQIQLEERIHAVENAFDKKYIEGPTEKRVLRKDKPRLGYENKGDVAANVANITQTSKAIVFAVLEAYSIDIKKSTYLVECTDAADNVIQTTPVCYFTVDVINAVKHAVKNSEEKTECFRVFKTLNNKSMKLKVK